MMWIAHQLGREVSGGNPTPTPPPTSSRQSALSCDKTGKQLLRSQDPQLSPSQWSLSQCSPTCQPLFSSSDGCVSIKYCSSLIVRCTVCPSARTVCANSPESVYDFLLLKNTIHLRNEYTVHTILDCITANRVESVCSALQAGLQHRPPPHWSPPELNLSSCLRPSTRCALPRRVTNADLCVRAATSVMTFMALL